MAALPEQTLAVFLDALVKIYYYHDKNYTLEEVLSQLHEKTSLGMDVLESTANQYLSLISALVSANPSNVDVFLSDKLPVEQAEVVEKLWQQEKLRLLRLNSESRETDKLAAGVPKWSINLITLGKNTQTNSDPICIMALPNTDQTSVNFTMNKQNFCKFLQALEEGSALLQSAEES